MIRKLIILLFTCACFESRAQVNIITTIAGNGIEGHSGDNGPAINALLNWPCAICFDRENNIIFCDGSNHTLRKINLLTGIITNIAGNGSGGFSGDNSLAIDAMLNVPQGICIDTLGNIYIADALNYRIRKITLSTGIITTVVGNGIAGYSGDGGLAVDASINAPVGICMNSNYFFLCDYYNGVIRRVELLTGVIKTIAGNGISSYSGDGGLATAAEFKGPGDVFCDDAGNLFVADQFNGVIRRIDAITNVITTVAGNGTLGYSGDGGLATAAEMNEVTGLFVSHSGDIYVADYRNGAIRKVDAATHIITTVAGGEAGYGGDGGPATNAKLKCADLWVDNNGVIYIADYVNQRIRRVNNALKVNELSLPRELALYPNPTKGRFSMQAPAAGALLSIYNAAGQHVYEQVCIFKEVNVDVTNQPAGMYMVYVQYEGERYVSKIIKE